jgi:hypothetical protein
MLFLSKGLAGNKCPRLVRAEKYLSKSSENREKGALAVTM